MNEMYADYEVRSSHMAVAWFIIRADAEAFIRGLNLVDDSGYTVVSVNKTVKEIE